MTSNQKADLRFWEILARKKTHATQLRILDEFREVDELSPAQFARGKKGIDVGHAGYHFRVLAGEGFLELARTRPVRGAVEHFYKLGEPSREAVPA